MWLDLSLIPSAWRPALYAVVIQFKCLMVTPNHQAVLENFVLEVGG